MIESGAISKKKILVSNPGKQYTHQLLHALQKYDHPYHFRTSFWYKPGKFPYTLISKFPKKIKSKLEGIMKKRYFEKLDDKNIIQWPYFEIIRELSDKVFGQKYAEKMQFYRDRYHDKWVASKLDGKYKVVVGYEEACLLTFRKAKQKGITTILDLAQIHYKEITAISNTYPAFGDLYTNVKLRDKINSIKEEELTLADYVICLSDFAKDSLVKNGINPKKIFVANLGFDPSRFVPKETYVSSEKLKIVFAGTMTKRKGLDLLFQLNEELSDIIDLTFVGPMADAIDLFEKYKGKYTWFSYVEQTEMNEIFNRSDLFVFPSYLDSWAMVVVEAMASGLPVIVSDNTGAKDAVNEASGFRVPTGDLLMLREKIKYFYNNREELRRKGQNARLVSLQYQWKNYHETIDKILKDINGKN